MDGHTCITRPNYPNPYENNQECKIEIHSTGTLTSTNFSSEGGFDVLSIGGVDYSGEVGPVNVSVQAGTSVTWKSDYAMNRDGWQVCWSSGSGAPLTKSLKVLSLARNYITGDTNHLEQQPSLQTLLIFSNYLTCQSAELTDSKRLGQSDFVDPTSSTLQEAGMVLQGISMTNPFQSVPNNVFPNTVLAFAGNVQESLIAPISARRLN